MKPTEVLIYNKLSCPKILLTLLEGSSNLSEETLESGRSSTSFAGGGDAKMCIRLTRLLNGVSTALPSESGIGALSPEPEPERVGELTSYLSIYQIQDQFDARLTCHAIPNYLADLRSNDSKANLTWCASCRRRRGGGVIVLYVHFST